MTNRLLEICQQEAVELKHLLHPPQTREFPTEFQRELQLRLNQYATELLKRAGWFSKARNATKIDELDLRQAAELMVQEELGQFL